jgi:hypothetical protein
MKPRAEVAKWQTQLTQNQPRLKPRVGSSPTFGRIFKTSPSLYRVTNRSWRRFDDTLRLVRTFHCSSFFNSCLMIFSWIWLAVSWYDNSLSFCSVSKVYSRKPGERAGYFWSGCCLVDISESVRYSTDMTCRCAEINDFHRLPCREAKIRLSRNTLSSSIVSAQSSELPCRGH